MVPAPRLHGTVLDRGHVGCSQVPRLRWASEQAQDTSGARRCHGCVGEGEQAQCDHGSRTATASHDPWTDGAVSGGSYSAWQSCSLVNNETTPSAAQHDTSTYGGGCSERVYSLCVGSCEKGFCQRHLFQCRACDLYPLCHNCLIPEEHQCFVDCENASTACA